MSMTKNTPGYVTIREAAKEFCISLRTIKRLIYDDKVITRYRQHGRTEILLERAEVARVLEPQPIGA